MKQWYSAFELAGLTGLPALPNNITRKAKAEKWQSRQRSGRGGGKEGETQKKENIARLTISYT